MKKVLGSNRGSATECDLHFCTWVSKGAKWGATDALWKLHMQELLEPSRCSIYAHGVNSKFLPCRFHPFFYDVTEAWTKQAHNTFYYVFTVWQVTSVCMGLSLEEVLEEVHDFHEQMKKGRNTFKNISYNYLKSLMVVYHKTRLWDNQSLQLFQYWTCVFSLFCLYIFWKTGRNYRPGLRQEKIWN